jgi:four helix bundle protein
MAPSDWTPGKPYDLRERLFEFACLIVRLVQFLHTRGAVAIALSYQVLRCGTSPGANYEEADDGSSVRDAIAKKKIALRELKETRFRLRVLRQCRFLGLSMIQSSPRATNSSGSSPPCSATTNGGIGPAES